MLHATKPLKGIIMFVSGSKNASILLIIYGITKIDYAVKVFAQTLLISVFHEP
jgi:hypothetical protein